MLPKICVTLPAQNISNVLKTIKRLEPQAPDLIEIRFDFKKNEIEPNKIREITNIPLIATARLKKEGGLWEGNERTRINLLIKAGNAGFNYIDLEASTLNLLQAASELHETGSKLIISYHEFEKTPAFKDMEEMNQNNSNSGKQKRPANPPEFKKPGQNLQEGPQWKKSLRTLVAG